MIRIRRLLNLSCCAAILFMTQDTSAQVPVSAETRLNELGPENEEIAKRVGRWDVVETVWSSPDAAPLTIRRQIAERRMIGSVLQETIWSKPGPAQPSPEWTFKPSIASKDAGNTCQSIPGRRSVSCRHRASGEKMAA